MGRPSGDGTVRSRYALSTLLNGMLGVTNSVVLPDAYSASLPAGFVLSVHAAAWGCGTVVEAKAPSGSEGCSTQMLEATNPTSRGQLKSGGVPDVLTARNLHFCCMFFPKRSSLWDL